MNKKLLTIAVLLAVLFFIAGYFTKVKFKATVPGHKLTANLSPLSPIIVARLDQTGVSTANSGVAQTFFTAPVSGYYRLGIYIPQSAGCATLGPAALSLSESWTDATTTRTDTGTLPLATSPGATNLLWNIQESWIAASTNVTVTFTYTACSSGTWTYDNHAYVERLY
jgi:hypothetical protein